MNAFRSKLDTQTEVKTGWEAPDHNKVRRAAGWTSCKLVRNIWRYFVTCLGSGKCKCPSGRGQSKQQASAPLPDYRTITGFSFTASRLFFLRGEINYKMPAFRDQGHLSCFAPLLYSHMIITCSKKSAKMILWWKWTVSCPNARVSLLGTNLLAESCERACLSPIYTLTFAGYRPYMWHKNNLEVF